MCFAACNTKGPSPCVSPPPGVTMWESVSSKEVIKNKREEDNIMRNIWLKNRPEHRLIFKRYMIITMMMMIFLVNAFPTGSAAASEEEGGSSVSVDTAGADVTAVENLAEALYRANSGRFSSTSGGFSWDTEGKSRSWTYYNGIMMDAYLMMDSGAYFSSVNTFFDNNISQNLVTRRVNGQNTTYYDQANGITFGYVNNAAASDNYYRPNELDSIPPVRVLFDLLRDPSGRVTSAQKAKYIKMIEYVYGIMQSRNWDVKNSRNQVVNVGGNFKHKYNNSSWSTYQVALDGLYMAQPFFMELANALEDGIFSGSSTTLNMIAPADIYTAVCERMIWVGNNLYDSSTGLYHHGWGPDAGLNGVYWLRAVGWYAAALADVISMLPDSYTVQKEELIRIEKQLFAGMRNRQDPSGLWYNVLNESVSTNSSTQNLPETSGSALLAYAMMKSFAQGYVDEEDGEAGLKAFHGIVDGYVSQNTLTNVYRSAGVSTNPADYLKAELYKPNEAKGVGPLMMAACYAGAAAAGLQKHEPEVIPPEVKALTYNGMEQELVTAGSVTGGTMYYALGENADTAPTDEEQLSDGGTADPVSGGEDELNGGDQISVWTTTIPSAVSAGTWYVWYKAVGDSRHTDTVPAVLEAAIARKSVTVSGITAEDKTYDGTTDAVLVFDTAVLDGRVGDDILTVTAAGAFEDEAAGENKAVAVTDLSLTGTDADNYELAEEGQQTAAAADISAADLSEVTAQQEGTLTYNGADQTAEVNTTAVSVNEQEVSFTYSASEEGEYGDSVPAFRDAGDHTVYYKAAAPNHNVSEGSFPVSIEKKTVTVTADEKSKTYGEEDPELTAGIEGVENGDVLSYTLTRAAGEDVDEYDITVTPGENPNYLVETEPGRLTITPKSIGSAEAALSETEIFYTGSGQSVSVISVTLDGLALTSSDYEVSGTKGTDPGSYVVTITGKGNYKDTVTVPWSIVEAPPEIRMVLPSSLTMIEAEAFMRTAASVVCIQDNVTTIGERAFYESSSLRQVYIPASVTFIGEDAFAGCSSALVIIGEPGSYAETWASGNGFVFVERG